MDINPDQKMILNIVKIGGQLIDDDRLRSALTSGLSSRKEAFIVVHGGGSIASAMSAELGIEPKMHEGRRITDEATLKVVIMTYGGLINKTLVAELQAAGVNAIGLTGADGNLMTAVKRPAGAIDFGLVGDITSVQPQVLEALLQAGFVPVIAPLTHDGSGQLLNTNADTIAAAVASAMAEKYSVRLLFIMDKKGVLEDTSDENSVIPELTVSSVESLRERGIIRDGMLPKLKNAMEALKNGVAEVILTNVAALSEEKGMASGTRIVSNE